MQAASLMPGALKYAFRVTLVKLSPHVLIHNPVMLTVMVSAVATAILTVFPHLLGGYSEPWFNAAVCALLLTTVLFGNFAEALAEGRGKAQADYLNRMRSSVEARRRTPDGGWEQVPSERLQQGDIVLVRAGELIPGDGEIIDGVASVDEAAITGESAPVIRGAGTDFNAVIGGTAVISNEIAVRITAEPGDAMLDRMITLVSGAKRQKAPNEKALHTLIVGLNNLFIIVCAMFVPAAIYAGYTISPAMLVALLVCLIPTTIGGLLSAIGISGMSRVAAFNVIAKSGKAVEVAGDIHTVIFDKTGTITFGNRRAEDLLPVDGVIREQLAEAAWFASHDDNTPEGLSTRNLAEQLGGARGEGELAGAIAVPFDAATRMSGIDLKDGRTYRKGAVDAIRQFVGGAVPAQIDEMARRISVTGGTPLAVAADGRVLGIVHLKDTVKPGIKEEIAKLRTMGITTIMCTGDNALTAATIALEADVDEFISEATPEDKLKLIRREHAAGRLVAMTGDGTNDAPALAQADVGIAMSSGTTAAREAANMVDLDSDPAKILRVIAIGKQMLITRGAITTFSIANDVAKYFAVLPAMLVSFFPPMNALNIMGLSSPVSAVLSALIYNAFIILLLMPIAVRGVRFTPRDATQLLRHNMVVYGLGGLIAPFIGIKLIDMALTATNIAALR